jgi:sugar/nucleoside kinase (ribokinase family)
MPWPPIEEVCTSVSYVITESASSQSTILSEGGAREVRFPLNLIEMEMARAEACCLVSPGVNDQIAPILKIAERCRVPVFFGLGSKHKYQELRAALVTEVETLMGNRAEAALFTGFQSIDDQLNAMSFDGRVRTTIVSDGANGIYSLHEGRRIHIPAYLDCGRPIMDDCGAGDAAQGTIVHFLLEGFDLESALMAGARQGFEACTAYGATTNLLDELRTREYLSLAVGIGVG